MDLDLTIYFVNRSLSISPRFWNTFLSDYATLTLSIIMIGTRYSTEDYFSENHPDIV